jgi:hypothetical protein
MCSLLVQRKMHIKHLWDNRFSEVNLQNQITYLLNCVKTFAECFIYNLIQEKEISVCSLLEVV